MMALARSAASADKAIRLAVVALACAATGCSSPTEDASVIEALLKTLTSDGREVCIDRRTKGEALTVYRTMLRAPTPSRRPLGWFAPGPLQPGQAMSLGRIVDDELRNERTVLPVPDQDRAKLLPPTEQTRLDTAAAKLVFRDSEPGGTVAAAASAPTAKVRWWVRNRIDTDCRPVYTLSAPVVSGDLAFVSVMAAHWGTIYAIERKNGAWSTTARWSNWLY